MSAKVLGKVRSFLRSLKGLRCWYVSFGGAAGPAFQLALGKKVRRLIPLKNPAHGEEFRHFEGEANFLVWCSWRLDNLAEPLSSSDDTPEGIGQSLPRLRQTKVRGVSLINQAGDLKISFSNGLKLWVFCDHVPGSPSFDGNWELWRAERALIVGPGARFDFLARRADEAEHTGLGKAIP